MFHSESSWKLFYNPTSNAGGFWFFCFLKTSKTTLVTYGMRKWLVFETFSSFTFYTFSFTCSLRLKATRRKDSFRWCKQKFHQPPDTIMCHVSPGSTSLCFRLAWSLAGEQAEDSAPRKGEDDWHWVRLRSQAGRGLSEICVADTATWIRAKQNIQGVTSRGFLCPERSGENIEAVLG